MIPQNVVFPLMLLAVLLVAAVVYLSGEKCAAAVKYLNNTNCARAQNDGKVHNCVVWN